MRYVLACIPFWRNFKWKNEWPLKKHIKRFHIPQTFFIIILNMTYDFHHVCLKSCIGSHLGAWLSTHLVIPSFCITFNIFSLTLCTKLGLPNDYRFNPLHMWPILKTWWGYTFCNVLMEKNVQLFMMLFGTPFFPLLKMSSFIFFMNTHMFSQFIHHHFKSYNNLLTLCYSHMGSTLWLTLSSLIPFE